MSMKDWSENRNIARTQYNTIQYNSILKFKALKPSRGSNSESMKKELSIFVNSP